MFSVSLTPAHLAPLPPAQRPVPGGVGLLPLHPVALVRVSRRLPRRGQRGAELHRSGSGAPYSYHLLSHGQSLTSVCGGGGTIASLCCSKLTHLTPVFRIYCFTTQPLWLPTLGDVYILLHRACVYETCVFCISPVSSVKPLIIHHMYHLPFFFCIHYRTQFPLFQSTSLSLSLSLSVSLPHPHTSRALVQEERRSNPRSTSPSRCRSFRLRLVTAAYSGTSSTTSATRPATSLGTISG